LAIKVGQVAFGQGVEDFAVAEEAGDADQQFAVQGGDLARPRFDQAYILAQVAALANRNTAFDAAQHRARLVEGEVELGLFAQEGKNPRQAILVGQHQAGTVGLGGKRASQESRQPGRHFLGWQDDVDQAGVDGGSRHAVELGGFRALRHDHPAGLLDRAQSTHAIASGSRQDNANGFFALILAQRAQEDVDGQVQSLAVVDVSKQQLAMKDAQYLAWRDEVDRVGLDVHPLLGPAHRHGGSLRQKFDHQALVVWRQVLNHDEGAAGVDRRGGKEGFECFEATGRGADTDKIGGGAGCGYFVEGWVVAHEEEGRLATAHCGKNSGRRILAKSASSILTWINADPASRLECPHEGAGIPPCVALLHRLPGPA
jgi:hypothetical protein